MGTHNVVYVATEHDSVYAFDADSSSCQILWQVSLINPAAGVTTVPASDIPGQTDIVPEIGITGTPVIDPATATLYVVAKTKINQGSTPSYKQELHALDLTTGAERTDLGAPVVIQGPSGGAFDALTENQRSALLLAGSQIYVAFDSYSDVDPFHGWLFAYDAANLQNPPAVFNTTPNGSRGGIGESGAAPSSDVAPSSTVGGNVFLVSSDGTIGAPNTGTDYPDTLLKLQTNTASNGFRVVDTFTRANETSLAFQQKYFGSTGVLLLPDAAGSATHPHLAIAGDEAGNLYLLDRDHLAADGALQTLCLGLSLTGTPAYWVSNNTPTIYLAAAGDGLKAFRLANGTLNSTVCPSPATPSSQSSEMFSTFGASAVVSSNRSSSGIVWALDTSGYVTGAPAILRAYDATNLANRLYGSSAIAGDPQAAGPAVKFAVPTVANGKVYVGTQNELSVFGLP